VSDLKPLNPDQLSSLYNAEQAKPRGTPAPGWATPITRTQPEPSSELDAGDYAADIGMAIPRGIEGAVQDLYGFADWASFDSLPDYKDEDRIFGTSKTIAGGIVEGIANFGSGMIVGSTWLSGGAKIGKGIKLASGLSKAAETAAVGQKVLGGMNKAKVIAGARNLTAGAMSDFFLFDGQSGTIGLRCELQGLRRDDEGATFSRITRQPRNAFLAGSF